MNLDDSKYLVLGIGSDILSDDAIGPKLVLRLKENLDREKVSYHTAAVGGMEIIELIGGYKNVVIIDAIKTRNGEPGAVYHLTPNDFRETVHLSSFHDMNFLTALEFGRKMDISIPDQIDIIAIEIVEDLTFSNEYSPMIADRFDQIYEHVANLVYELLPDLK